MDTLNLTEKVELLRQELQEWESNFTFDLRSDFSNIVFDIRKNILEDIRIPKIDMLTYKKAIIKQIQSEYVNTRQYSFTDEELLENRIKNIPTAKDMKVTKLLSKEISKERIYLSGDQRLDYFHKLADFEKEYYITGNPLIMARMYNKVDTCISPDGENQAAIFQYLLSPYFYLVYSSDFKNRILVAINKDKNLITASRVYGSYDFMMSASFAKWCVDNNYTFVTRYFSMLNTDGFQYIDSPDRGIETLVEYFGGNVDEEMRRENLPQAFTKPEHCTFKGDAITGEEMFFDNISTTEHIHSNCSHIMRADTEYCGECGSLVHTEYYDEYEGMCYECARDHNYCEECDEFYSQAEYDFNENMCNYCIERREEEEEEDIE